MSVTALPSAPSHIDTFNEIATQYSYLLPALYNQLSPQERVFIYYIFRAGLPGNRIVTDQIHRYGLHITHIFEYIVDHADKIEDHNFIADVKTYLVYLWTNHGQYFAKEHVHEKRTPAKIGLRYLTEQALKKVWAHIEQDPHELEALLPYIFEETLEPTNCVPDAIEESAVNLYAPDFTEADYTALPAENRNFINAYYAVRTDGNNRIPVVHRYTIGGKYSQELEIACYWLEKAYAHVSEHPTYFDEHMGTSLHHLIAFLKTGNESEFKHHSVAWTKTNSRVDYVFGFIETYQDPKGYCGMFQAEATIKTFDMQRINKLLPSLEQQLPFPDTFKRSSLEDTMPNASVNVRAFSCGELGPLQIVAAYCLPNYEELRAHYGSKQIIYQAEKGLRLLLNPTLSVQLSYHTARAQWLLKNDPDQQLTGDIWTAHCILHETLGHGSGKLDVHEFKAGDQLTIAGTQYVVGDTVPVTSDNLNEFLGAGEHALEELRAEIIALYTSITSFDELANVGLYKQWPEKIGKDMLIEWLILDMLHTGLRRLETQPEQVVQVAGAHAQANLTIMYYLLDTKAVSLLEEKRIIEGKEYTVLDFVIHDTQKTVQAIEQLMIEVQRIKSQADGQALEKLLATYGSRVRNSEHLVLLQRNRSAVVGDLKISALLFPHFQPVHDSNGTIIDCSASWPKNIFEQFEQYRSLSLSTC
jgi:dipeptidyl-peptidase III